MTFKEAEEIMIRYNEAHPEHRHFKIGPNLEAKPTHEDILEIIELANKKYPPKNGENSQTNK